MIPTNFGLFIGYQGLKAAQTALNVVSHNITNINTEGYSKQRAEMATGVPYAYPTPDTYIGAGQVGQGVLVEEIKRLRDNFVDIQYRDVSSQAGYDSAVQEGLKRIQSLTADSTDTGLAQSLQAFFNAAQELSIQPQSIPARTAYLQSAQDVIYNFQTRANQLQDYQDQLISSTTTSELSVRVDSVNEKLQAIADLNKEILMVSSAGAAPNDLMDKRELALRELSKLVDITVTPLANNLVDVKIAGITMVRRGDVLDTLQLVANGGAAPPPSKVPTLIETVNGGDVLNDGAGTDEIQLGEIKGILDAAGNTGTLSSVESVLGDLNTLLVNFVNQVNTLQTAGRDLNGALAAANPLFTPAVPAASPLPIFQYAVNPTVLADPKLVAAANNDASVVAPEPIPGFAGEGDGRNALAIAKLRTTTIGALGGTFENFLTQAVTELGVDAQSYDGRVKNDTSLLTALDQRQQETSGVSLDEELTDMLRYQRQFEASSKIISVFDQVLQQIIGMVQ